MGGGKGKRVWFQARRRESFARNFRCDAAPKRSAPEETLRHHDWARAPSKRHQEATRLSGSTALKDALEDLPSTCMSSTYSRDQTNGACFNTAFARFDVSSQGLAVMRAMYGYVRDRNGWRTPCPIGPLMQHVYDSVDGAIPDDIAEAVMVLDEAEALISSNQENCVEFQQCMVPKKTRQSVDPALLVPGGRRNAQQSMPSMSAFGGGSSGDRQ
jgi:hypothetical protein